MVDVSVAEVATALIGCFEGMRLKSYQDSGGVWTIGIGHTKGVQANQTITEDAAARLFEVDCAPLLAAVSGRPVLEAAALVSFGFNVGLKALQNVLAGNDQIFNPAHTKDRRGNVLAGLVNRRRLEELLIQLSLQQATAVHEEATLP